MDTNTELYNVNYKKALLTDFGLAKQYEENTRSNSLCGTMEYMSPEIILGKGHDKAADWWSVGILLFEMLTGKVSILQNCLHKSIYFSVFITCRCKLKYFWFITLVKVKVSNTCIWSIGPR